MVDPIDTSRLGPVSILHGKQVFVFGANEAGRHGRGSAREAVRNWGAIYGQGFGRQGNAFGIPTKDKDLKKLSLVEIAVYVGRFLEYAANHQDIEFQVVCIGCGLAAYTPAQIAPMFRGHTPNVRLQGDFVRELVKQRHK